MIRFFLSHLVSIGGHVNPAVTLGMASVGKISWAKVPHYFLGQYIGAFSGASIVYLIYKEAISEKVEAFPEISYNMTASIFIPTAGEGVSDVSRLIDQVITKQFTPNLPRHSQ